MESTKFIGNCHPDIINCDDMVREMQNSIGDERVGSNPYRSDLDLPENLKKEFETMYARWKNAGYMDLNNFKFTNYRPERHFSQSYIYKLSDYLDLVPLNVWVSSLSPGCVVPFHWDIEAQENEWKKKGELVRYTVFVCEPKIGHVMIVDEDCFHMPKKGSVYRWNKWNDYHIGMNAGLEQKYILHLVGLDRNAGR